MHNHRCNNRFKNSWLLIGCWSVLLVGVAGCKQFNPKLVTQGKDTGKPTSVTQGKDTGKPTSVTQGKDTGKPTSVTQGQDAGKHVSADPGGIPNVGNTCYLNSALQIIAKLYPDTFERKKSPLSAAGQKIVQKIKCNEKAATYEAAQAFYKAFEEVNKQYNNNAFGGNLMADTEEAFVYLLNRGLNDDEIKDRQFTITSSVEDITTTPPKFNNRSDHALFSILYLNPPQKAKDMQEVFLETFKNSKNTYEFGCSQDGTKENLESAYKGYKLLEVKKNEKVVQEKYDIEGESKTTISFSRFDNLPNKILPVLLKRQQKNKKNIQIIKNPFQLTIPTEKVFEGGKNLDYNLVGFVVHEGIHYKTYIKSDKEWKQYNDSRVTPANITEVNEAAGRAYLYFYKRTS